MPSAPEDRIPNDDDATPRRHRRTDRSGPRPRLSAAGLTARIRAALRADPWWADLADQLPEPAIVATGATPNWRVAAWRNPDVLLTDDHLKVIARAVERVRDAVDWDGT